MNSFVQMHDVIYIKLIGKNVLEKCPNVFKCIHL